MIILFICVHNSGRSQMAEAFLNKPSDGKAAAISAGTEPAAAINPVVVAAMHEVSIDIGHQEPKRLTLETIDQVDRVITMGCGVEEVCPATFIETEDWDIDDPNEQPIERVREIREQIQARVMALLKELNQG
jgi:protein-tyrosine-phosphatase